MLPLVFGPNACDADASEEAATNQPTEERQLEALIGPGGAYLQMAVWAGLVSWTASGRCALVWDVHKYVVGHWCEHLMTCALCFTCAGCWQMCTGCQTPWQVCVHTNIIGYFRHEENTISWTMLHQ